MTSEYAAHLHYDHDAGVLYWLQGQDAGKIAGSMDARGYVRINWNRSKRLVHRVVWSLVYGDPVPPVLDHIDRNPANNHISNLRAVSQSTNLRNNKKGVSYHRGKWRVNFGTGKGRIQEEYSTEDEAWTRRLQLMREHGVIT